MFFEKDDLSITILDVIELDQKNINMFNTSRNFNALSFRISAETMLYTSNKKYQLLDNSVCFIPANIEYTRVSEIDKLIVIHFNTLNYYFNEIEFFQPHQHEIYENLFKEMYNYWNSKKISYQYKCTSAFYRILAECYKENFSPKDEQNDIYQSIKFMKDNFNNPSITIEDIANKSFISTVYFRKLFKDIYGISPIQHLIRLRIEYAINLMNTGYYSLYEISKLSGYNDYSYFSSQFKKIKGVSPSDYYYNYKE